MKGKFGHVLLFILYCCLVAHDIIFQNFIWRVHRLLLQIWSSAQPYSPDMNFFPFPNFHVSLLPYRFSWSIKLTSRQWTLYCLILHGDENVGLQVDILVSSIVCVIVSVLREVNKKRVSQSFSHSWMQYLLFKLFN